MANDRIFLRCPKCRLFFRLMSYFPSWTGRGPADGLEDWMDRHLKGCREITSDLDGNPFFDLVTETGNWITPEEWKVGLEAKER